MNIIKPNWHDIERVWMYFTYLCSPEFRNLFLTDTIVAAHEKTRHFDERDFEWPKTHTERSNLVNRYMDEIIGAFLHVIRPIPGLSSTTRTIYEEPFISTLSSLHNRRISPEEANIMIVSDNFPFTKFMYAFVDEMSSWFYQMFMKQEWRAFGNAWNNPVEALERLTREHKRRLGNDELYIYPIEIQKVLSLYVDGVVKSVELHGGNISSLFPWPVR